MSTCFLISYFPGSREEGRGKRKTKEREGGGVIKNAERGIREKRAYQVMSK